MRKNGFALIEIVTVLGILTILFSLTVPQLFRLRDRNTLQTTSTKLLSLIRQQQLSAMNTSQLHGIYFDQSRYIQFSGNEYVSTNPENTITTLEYPLQFSNIQLPNSQIVFASGSGEIVQYDANSRSLVLEDTSNNEQKTMYFNALGVPIDQ